MDNSFAGFGYLGENSQRLRGKLADEYDVLAIPDTGAERNVMSLGYALAHGLAISKNRDYLQFADGSWALTQGCVDTHWTFPSGERIPITFAVLRDCCSDVILGDDFLEEHRIFEDPASALTTVLCETLLPAGSLRLHPDMAANFRRARPEAESEAEKARNQLG